MRVLAVQHREIFPPVSRAVQSLELARNPPRLVVRISQFRDANFFSLGMRGGQHLGREALAALVLSDNVRRHPQNVRCGTVIFRQRHAVPAGVIRILQSRESFFKNGKARERSSPKTVNGLVVVAHHKNISWLRA